MPLDYNDPWLIDRSRAMHSEMDAAPQDAATQCDIVARHLASAKADRRVRTNDRDGHNDLLRGLDVAANPDAPQSDRWMHVFLGLLSMPPPPPPPDPNARVLTPKETVAFFKAALARTPETP